MFENDDAILPDDFEETPSEEVAEEVIEEKVSEEVETDVEDTKPTEEATPEETKFKLKLKYNSEELEIDEDKARELAQKGMNYDKAIERAKQESLDEYIASQNYEWNGNPIKTKSEYDQAMAEQELINKYKGQDLPEEVIKELVESKKFRDQYQNEKQQNESKSKQEKDMQEFIEAFPDVKGDDVKPETWEKVNSGVPLKYAYMEQERAELLSKAKVSEQNETNKKRAPVKGVSTHGTEDVSGDPFLDGFDSI